MHEDYLNQLRTIRSQTLAIIEEITKSPKPTYAIDGQSVSWETYLKQLQSTVSWCNTQLASESPCEIRTQAGT